MSMNECKTGIDYEFECKKLKEKLECMYAENKDLKCSLDKVKTHLKDLESSNNRLLKKVEFLKCQIEAYQYIVNCRR